MTLVSAVQLSKTYRAGDVDVPAVRDVDFTIEPGAFVAFVGPSGSGKSTLLNMIGCLDHPTSGRLSVLDTDVATLDRRAAADFRGANIGFIFQDFNLIPVLTAYENIEYPLIMVQDWPEEKRRAQRGGAARRRRHGGSGGQAPGPDLGRAEAARGGGARARDATPSSCWPTSRPPISTTTPPTASSSS